MTDRRQSTDACYLLAFALLLLCGEAHAVEEESLAESPITESDRDHWAFQPLRRLEVPEKVDHKSVVAGVDAFILAKLAKKGMGLAPEADRATLLRRVSFDLIGLPPTVEEQLTFQDDLSPDAYERQVDRLLASPAHGERWAQHWLDLARYAETDGFEHDKLRPEAWKYRDWVIDALNADLPYDQFVAWQVAGDEFVKDGEHGALDSRLAAATATTFCLAGPDMPDQNDQDQRRHDLLNELTSTVGSALLGLQLGCAQCHDHKYDPISQADFYRLRAVFEPAVPLLKREQPVIVLASQKTIPAARLWIRGDHRRPGPVLQPGFPRIADASGDKVAMKGEAEASETGSRLNFAAWLFRDENPLTARVMANRVWQHHFGRGIFDTPSDVGLINSGPTHPELLDWLAVELRDDSWSVKKLHRTIVLSGTYRQASRKAGETDERWAERLTLDPENSLYSRYPRKRLDGESLRDAMLFSADLLSAERGGPGVMPPLPQELTSTLLKGQWSASNREADHYKRSVYLFARRNLRYPLFEAFDRPDANASCPIRSRSTTAPQSLALLNGEFPLLAAKHLAAKLLAGSESTDDAIRDLYRCALGRQPTEDELSTVNEFLLAQQALLTAENRSDDSLALPIGGSRASDRIRSAALVDACLAIFNSSEFVYID